MKRASILLAAILVLTALPVLAAQPAASTQQPAPMTLEQVLGGQNGATDAVIVGWCYPSIHCSVHDDCDAFCGDPAFGYCEWNRCCSCLG